MSDKQICKIFCYKIVLNLLFFLQIKLFIKIIFVLY